MTKICTKCKKELSIEDFNWRDKKKGTRRSECKYCHSQYMKDKYKEKHSEIEKLKSTQCCAKCGETRYYLLDFHHINPEEKEETIARMISNNYELDKVYNEIEKCITLCANCHREFHFFERNNGINLQEYLS